MNRDGHNPHGHKAEDAALRPHRSTGYPRLSVQRRARKVMRKKQAAVRNGIEKRLAKIKAGMPTHSEPEIAGPSQRETEKQPGRDDARGAHKTLARVPKMHGAEQNGKKYSCGPESDPLCQRILRIASEQEFFRESYRDECHEPDRGPADHFHAVQR